MERRNKKIKITMLLIFCILFIFMTCCINDGTPKNISENEIYPKGDISNAKVFDTYHNEKVVSLNKEDAKYIVQTLKNSRKDLVTEYEGSLMELNIAFKDSTIQLVRKIVEFKLREHEHNYNELKDLAYKINYTD